METRPFNQRVTLPTGGATSASACVTPPCTNANTVPNNGGVGNCPSSLPHALTCLPSCNVGYEGTGERSCFERLLAEAKSRTASSDDSNEVSSSIFNKNKDSIDLAQSVTDRQVMETRPFNQRVTLPTGDRNL